MLRGGHEDEQRYKNRDYQHRGIAAGGDCGPLLIGLINQGKKTFCLDSMRRTLDIDIDLASNERRGREVKRRRGKVKVEFDIMELNLMYFIYIF